MAIRIVGWGCRRDDETCSKCGKHADRYAVDTEESDTYLDPIPLCVDCIPARACDKIAEIFDRILDNLTPYSRELMLRDHFMEFMKLLGGEVKSEPGGGMRGIDKWGWTILLLPRQVEFPWEKEGVSFVITMIPPTDKTTTPT